MRSVYTPTGRSTRSAKGVGEKGGGREWQNGEGYAVAVAGKWSGVASTRDLGELTVLLIQPCKPSRN